MNKCALLHSASEAAVAGRKAVTVLTYLHGVKVAILDESTNSGGVGATVSAIISEQCFDLLDAPVKRLCMDDAPVPYASSMEVAVVKRGSDVMKAVYDLVQKRI